MSKLLTMKNGHIFEVYDKSTIHDITIIFASPESAIDAWSQFTKENMETCVFDNMEYHDLVPLDMDLMRYDDAIIAKFEIRNKTEVEKIKDIIHGCLL